MSDPFDVLRNADPGRDVGSPADHWRIRERIIVDSVTKPSTIPDAGAQRPRWVAAVASVVALVAGTAALSGVLGGGALPTIALSSGGGNLAMSTEGAGDDAKMSMWMGNYVFTLADGVDIPAGSADVWRWPQPNRGDARDVARRLGVDGDVQRLPADYGGGWEVKTADGAYTTFSMYQDGSWYWWDPEANPWTIATTGCVAPEPAPDGTYDDTDKEAAEYERCVNVEPPAAKNLPSDAEARAAARRILADDASVKITDVYRDKWSVWVTAEYEIGDLSTGQFASIGLGGNGVVMNASGQWGTPDKVGAYPTISARDAVDRLLNGPFPYGPAVMSARGAEDAATSDMAVIGGGSSVASDGSTDGTSSGGGSAPDTGSAEPGVSEPSEPPVDIMPVDELPPVEMEDIKVTLVKVELSYTAYYGVDNVRWLLPSYLYTDSDGGTWTALAIEERYLGTEPPPYTTVLVDTTVPEPVDTTVPEPEPTPEPTDTTLAKPEEPDTSGS